MVFLWSKRGEMRGNRGQKTTLLLGLKVRHELKLYLSLGLGLGLPLGVGRADWVVASEAEGLRL